MKRPETLKAIKILWLAPNLNHYKARFLNHLANDQQIMLTVLSGEGRIDMGDKEIDEDCNFELKKVNVLKKSFGTSGVVRQEMKHIFNDFDWVLIPAEKKNILLFIFLCKLRKQFSNVRLFSYNHPILRSGSGKTTRLDIWLTKYYYKRLDRVVFYTELSWQWAVKTKLINSNKAFWANNTIDTSEIDKVLTFQFPPKLPNILFIGRLIPSKRISDLLLYYKRLKQDIPDLGLDIIGDGPESNHIKSALISDSNIKWHGTLINEEDIAPIMSKASLVFIPGHSGLSVNHAFAYGRPYVTLQGPSHAPELGYLTHGKDGYILDEDFEGNVKYMHELLSKRDLLELFCRNAKEKGDYLSVKNWVSQMKTNLIHE